MRRVGGVDPSLQSTGLAIITEVGTPELRTFLSTTTLRVPVDKTISHPALAEVERVREIVDTLCTSLHGCEAVYVESPAYASRTGKYAERAHLYFALLAALTVRRVTVETVTPAQLKKRVTGNGRAGKEDIINTVRDRWSAHGWVDTPKLGVSDRADASALAWVAAVEHGFDVEEPVKRST